VRAVRGVVRVSACRGLGRGAMGAALAQRVRGVVCAGSVLVLAAGVTTGVADGTGWGAGGGTTTLPVGWGRTGETVGQSMPGRDDTCEGWDAQPPINIATLASTHSRRDRSIGATCQIDRLVTATTTVHKTQSTAMVRAYLATNRKRQAQQKTAATHQRAALATSESDIGDLERITPLRRLLPQRRRRQEHRSHGRQHRPPAAHSSSA